MPQLHSLASGVLSGTDANDTAYIVNNSANKVRIKKISLIPKTAVAAHATNVIVTSVKKGATEIASQSTDSDTAGYGAHVAATVIDLSITGTGKDLEIDAQGVITIAVTKGGTGPAYNFQIVVQVEEIRG